ncbi:hypothetical protein KCU66_g67, partial [Aureobasidium melanogenum]
LSFTEDWVNPFGRSYDRRTLLGETVVMPCALSEDAPLRQSTDAGSRICCANRTTSQAGSNHLLSAMANQTSTPASLWCRSPEHHVMTPTT